MGPRGRYAWMSGSNGSKVFALDVRDEEVGFTVNLNESQSAIAISPDGRLFYATSDGSVATLDARDKGAVLIEKHTVSSDNRPGALWVSADGRTVAYSDHTAS